MRRPTSIAPPKGKLGVLMPGMGAVSTTFMAGVELVRRRLDERVHRAWQNERRRPVAHDPLR